MKRVLSMILAFVLVLGLFSVPVSVQATNTEETIPATQQTPAETETPTETIPEETLPEETEPEETSPEETEPEETSPEETEPEETRPEIEVIPPSGMTASQELIDLLKFEEGFCRYPVWDYSQYTVGYGTRCPDNMLSYYRAHGITYAEAEQLLRNTLANTEYLINTRLIEKYDLDMTQGQFDALVSFSYNMGPGWITSPSQNIHQQVAAGATGNTIIDALSRWCKAGGQVKSFLVRRRLSESYMYLEGKYAHTPPENYCYVLYDGNGGTTGQSVQGYNADFKGAPTGTATHSKYTFAGWYTQPNGGVKVEVLTEEYDKTTLYAHWEGQSYEEPDLLDEPIVVKVTADSVNLRKGPGTNYAVIGKARSGDVYEIWQVEVGGYYTWGYYKGGWICLDYTNYESVISGGAEDPTEPEATQPKPTDPTPTEPAPTEPEIETVEKIVGVVNADPYLCVRKGPGTGYVTVDTLRNGEKVEITERRTVGSTIWGKTAKGWICMSYVMIQNESQEQPTPTTGKTGTITCSSLNVRYGAGVSYSIVGTYRKGDVVTVTEEKTVGTTTWGKTAKGWISMDYVKLTADSGSGDSGETPEPDDETETTQLVGIVDAPDQLRVRSGAGTNYSVVGYVQPNSKITILEQKTVGATTWGRIAKGWISMDYVKLQSGSDEGTSGGTGSGDQQGSSTALTGTVISDDVLRVRSGAGTNYSAIGTLKPNTKVTILERKTVNGTVWGKISSGWVCMTYIKLDDGDAGDTLPEDSWEENEPQLPVIKTVTASCLLVRSGAGTSYSKVDYLYKGAKVTVTEIKTVGSVTWGKIANGWICLDYTI